MSMEFFLSGHSAWATQQFGNKSPVQKANRLRCVCNSAMRLAKRHETAAFNLVSSAPVDLVCHHGVRNDSVCVDGSTIQNGKRFGFVRIDQREIGTTQHDRINASGL